jgi:hypothetical protein
MRKSVVNRLFTFRPRQLQAAQRMAAPQLRTAKQRTAPEKEGAQAGEQPPKKKKRRRRRRKKK